MVSMPQGNISKAVIYTALILLVDALGIAGASAVLSSNLVSYFTLLMLLEAAVLLFTGGFRKPQIVTSGLSPTSRRDWSLILTGLILLVLSFLLAYPLGRLGH
jgi:hypothetical protein